MLKFGSTRQIRVITAHPAYKAPGYKAIPLMWQIFIGQNWSYKAGCTVSQIQRIQKGKSLTARPRPGANKRFFSPLNPPPTHVFLSLATERSERSSKLGRGILEGAAVTQPIKVSEIHT